MKDFSDFLVEEITPSLFKEQASSVKGLQLERVSDSLAAYSYKSIYFEIRVFYSTLKKLAEKEGLQYKEYSIDAEAKSDLFSISLGVENFEIKLKLRMSSSAKKDADVKKAFKVLNNLVKLLDARCKELKPFGKIAGEIKAFCAKNKKAVGDVNIKGTFDADGKLYALTLVPPRGRDVDSYFSEEFSMSFLDKFDPISKKADIRIEIAGSVSGTYVYTVSGLDELK